MKKKNQLVPAQSPHDNESNTVEIVVRSAQEDKSNQNKTHEIVAKVVRDNDDSWADGHEGHCSNEHNQGNNGEQENYNINASHKFLTYDIKFYD